MADVEKANAITTSLLTLLNVSAIRPGKRKRELEKFVPAEKLNKRKSVVIAESLVSESELSEKEKSASVEAEQEGEEEEEEEEEEEVLEENEAEVEDSEGSDLYELHFGLKPSALTTAARESVDAKKWTNTTQSIGKLGATVVSTPGEPSQSGPQDMPPVDILERLKTPFQARQAKQSEEQTKLQNDLLSCLSSRKDLYMTSVPLETKRSTREAIALHSINHVTKKRRRVLKNNERISHAAKANPNAESPEDVQDQGFTRPSVLFLLPFRSFALSWFNALTSHTPSPDFQVENRSRFLSEYGLPPDAVDKLAEAEPGTYPPDHVDIFKGNVDDNFRVGIKLTRKSVKMFTEFYGCDIIMASPLGLRRAIEKDKNADYLSSIEILVVDQMDALTMQNWEHVKFVMSHLNKLPKESHDTDFSRIKPWYLDGHAAYLRQSILLSSFETPETRALYNTSLQNVAGKIRTQRHFPPVSVPEGIEQSFIHFDCVSPKDEADKRFHHFTTQLLPAVLKSAVQSANAVVFVPSSFDFIRVHNYFRKHAGVSFTVLSEYSSNQDISRARQAFFHGHKQFLLISERFHFYKRYKLRGIRNLIFYGPPDHPQFFTELLSYPFLDDNVDASDLTCRVLYSKYDWFRLERIAGTEAALGLIKAT